MERVNSEGIRRGDLRFVLTQTRMVHAARRNGSCLLCRNGPVNEAALCDSCFSFLSEDESRLAQKWLTGEGPPGA